MFIKKPRFWDSKNFSIWPIILYPFSIIYLFVFYLISKLKKKQIFEIPIICVGNIYLGGTGKTPLVKEIYNILISIGKKPAIIKKYYNYVEDEISLLETTSKVFSDKNRSSSLRRLIQNNFNVAVMDDGFQDYSIKKDFSILCFNEKQWIGNGLVLPAGPLRESLNSLKKANCVFINGEKNIRDLYKSFDLDPPEIESSTIAGYILDISKKIPSYGETFKDNFFNYKVLSHSKKQISKVEISKIN